ncbi:hypothetical protein [Spirosoma jeollabukense]
MKLQLMIWPVVVLSAFSLPTINTFAPGSTTEPGSIVHANPLLLNNKAFDFTAFSMASKGTLTVVSSNPATTQIEKIPFRIYLRRNGNVVDKSVSNTSQSALEIDVAPVLAMAKPGDDLVIEPVRTSDSRARRSIKLKPFFNSDLLFPILRKRGDGC